MKSKTKQLNKTRKPSRSPNKISKLQNSEVSFISSQDDSNYQTPKLRSQSRRISTSSTSMIRDNSTPSSKAPRRSTKNKKRVTSVPYMKKRQSTKGRKRDSSRSKSRTKIERPEKSIDSSSQILFASKQQQQQLIDEILKCFICRNHHRLSLRNHLPTCCVFGLLMEQHDRKLSIHTSSSTSMISDSDYDLRSKIKMEKMPVGVKGRSRSKQRKSSGSIKGKKQVISDEIKIDDRIERKIQQKAIEKFQIESDKSLEDQRPSSSKVKTSSKKIDSLKEKSVGKFSSKKSIKSKSPTSLGSKSSKKRIKPPTSRDSNNSKKSIKSKPRSSMNSKKQSATSFTNKQQEKLPETSKSPKNMNKPKEKISSASRSVSETEPTKRSQRSAVRKPPQKSMVKSKKGVPSNPIVDNSDFVSSAPQQKMKITPLPSKQQSQQQLTKLTASTGPQSASIPPPPVSLAHQNSDENEPDYQTETQQSVAPDQLRSNSDDSGATD